MTVQERLYFTFVIKLTVDYLGISRLILRSFVTSAFAFVFNICRPVLENANVKCEHDHLLPQNPFLTFDANADVTCEQGLIEFSRITQSWQCCQLCIRF